jgi:hypothetical protein
MKFTSLTTSCLVFFFSVTSVAVAETTDEKIKRLEDSILILDKENDILEEQLRNEKLKIDLLKLKLPNLTSDIEGKIQFNKIDIENQISAYRAMDKIADKVQKEIIDNLGSNISLIFLDKTYVQSLLNNQINYKNYKGIVNKLKEDYKKLEISSNTIINVIQRFQRDIELPVVSNFLFNSLKLFRTDKVFTGSSVSIKNKAFIASLSNKLRQNNKTVSIYNPNEYPLIIVNATEEIIGELNELTKYAKITESILLSETTEVKKQKLAKFIKDFTDLTNSLKNDKTLLPSIIKHASFKKINYKKDERKVYLVFIEISAGGTSRSTRNIFTNRLRYSGGVIVNYIIYDYEKAEVVFSNLHDEYTGFKKIRGSK